MPNRTHLPTTMLARPDSNSRLLHIPVIAWNQGAPSLLDPTPYVPAPRQYPQIAMFFSDSLKCLFFMYLVDMTPARPDASTR